MNFIKKGIFFLFAATVLVACSDDDDPVVVDPGTDDPVVNNHPLAGTSWSFSPTAGAMGVGPAVGDTSWWASSADDVATRSCLFDDTYNFNEDGTFTQVMQDSSWLESWQAGAPTEGCGTPIAPHNGSNDATWSADTSVITIVGDGAFLGLSKVHNSGEDGNPADDTTAYNYVLDGDTLSVTISGFQSGGDETWSYVFTKN